MAVHGQFTPVEKRVLSIQSHVCSGYVGNRASTFPLQLLGWDVDVVNTVQFSNHTGYGRWGGYRNSAEVLRDVLDSMAQNKILAQAHILTGYVPGAEALAVVIDVVRKARKENPDLVYLLDPVMGDQGKVYVAPDVIPIYRDMLNLADIITPNAFEVELLTGVRITSLSTLHTALKLLHTTHNLPHVIISSLSLPPFALPSTPPSSSSDPLLYCISSTLLPTSPPTLRVHAITFPEIPGYFSGVGDLFSALILAHFSAPSSPTTYVSSSALPPTMDRLARAAELAVASVQAILIRTQQAASGTEGTDDELDAKDLERRVKRMRARELRLIQSKREIEDPPVVYRAVPVAFDALDGVGPAGETR